MAYQVVKGWPSDGAIDEVITLATAGTVTPGLCGVIDSSGEGLIGAYPTTEGATSIYPAFFCIDADEVTGKVTGLMSPCVIEMDSDHYAAGAYAPGVKLSLTDGKFSIIAATGDARPAVASVLAYNATTGKLRVLWG